MERRRAVIATDRAQRYMDQLIRHAVEVTGSSHPDHIGTAHQAPPVDVEHHGDTVRLTFAGLGGCTLAASGDQLTLQVDATEPASAERMTVLLTADLNRFSQRNPLVVTWHQL